MPPGSTVSQELIGRVSILPLVHVSRGDSCYQNARSGTIKLAAFLATYCRSAEVPRKCRSSKTSAAVSRRMDIQHEDRNPDLGCISPRARNAVTSTLLSRAAMYTRELEPDVLQSVQINVGCSPLGMQSRMGIGFCHGTPISLPTCFTARAGCAAAPSRGKK